MRMAAIWPPVTAVFADATAKSFGARHIYIDIEQIKPDKAACLLRWRGLRLSGVLICKQHDDKDAL